MTLKKHLFPLFIFSVFIISCNSEIEYKISDTGLKYRFLVQNTDREKVKLHDVLFLKMIYTTENDSVLFSSYEISEKFRMKQQKSSHKGGCFEDAMSMLSVGDSLHFLIKARLFYKETRKSEIPKGVDPESELKFFVKLSGKQSEDRAAKEILKKKRAARANEFELLSIYIKEKKIKVNPTNSGLYYIETKEGNGKRAIPGSIVKVHYSGRFIDDKIFDSSYDRGKPIEFVLGKRQVIQGWEEGISKMAEGGQATLIIPSYLAYGDKQKGNIPPNSTLVFDVELIEVID